MKRPWVGMLDTQVLQVDWTSGLTARENRRVLRKGQKHMRKNSAPGSPSVERGKLGGVLSKEGT